MHKFRLERVIEIKNKLMDDKKNELELTNSALYRVNDALGSLDIEIKKNYETMAAPMGGSDFSVLKDFLYSLDTKKDGLMSERDQINQKIITLKGQLVELAKEIKMLDTLKAKAWEREKKLLTKKEQKNLDDMALRTLERKP
jgi:flagellar export protein FliJ